MWGNQDIGALYIILVYNIMDSALTDWYMYTVMVVEGAGGGARERDV